MDDRLADLAAYGRSALLRVAGWVIDVEVPRLPVVGVDRALAQVRDGLDVLVGWLASAAAASEVLDPAVIGPVVQQLGQVDAVLLAGLTRSVVAAEEAGCADGDGQASQAAWLADRLQLTRTAAGQLARLAAALDGMPQVQAQLDAGAISRDQAIALVRADEQRRKAEAAAAAAAAAEAAAEAERLARAAEAAAKAAADAEEAERIRAAAERLARQQADAAARAAAEAAAAAEAKRRAEQEDLLDAARAGTAPDDLAATAARARAADGAAHARSEAAQHTRRWARTWWDAETGQGRGAWALPADEQEVVLALLEALRTFDEPDAEEFERRTFEQRQADALIDLIRTAARAGTAPESRGQKPHIAVTVPGTTLTGDGEEPGQARHGTLLSSGAMRRWLCDAAISLVVLSATSQVLAVGRSTRTWTAAQHRAAEVSFGGCGFPTGPGRLCGSPMGRTELHHVRWWRHGGCTDTDNAVPLCTRHHRMVHHDGWVLDYDHDGQQISVTHDRPDGTRLTRTVDLRRPCPPPPRDQRPLF